MFQFGFQVEFACKLGDQCGLGRIISSIAIERLRVLTQPRPKPEVDPLKHPTFAADLPVFGRFETVRDSSTQASVVMHSSAALISKIGREPDHTPPFCCTCWGASSPAMSHCFRNSFAARRSPLRARLPSEIMAASCGCILTDLPPRLTRLTEPDWPALHPCVTSLFLELVASAVMTRLAGAIDQHLADAGSTHLAEGDFGGVGGHGCRAQAE